MRIAVTGGTGFLGRYVLRELVAHGHALKCWYRPESDRTGIDSGGISWLPGRLGDVQATRALLEGVDAVVHAAVDWDGPGRRHNETDSGQMLAFFENNVLGSLLLFEEAYVRQVPRFVYIASCAVHEVILNDRPLDETHPLWPTSHYGAHKAALEAFVHSYGLGKGWNISSLRPTGIYGMAHPAEKSRWFDLVARVSRGEPVDTARGGKEVHAADVARAVTLLLGADAETIRGQAYNCYDRYVSEQEVARIAKELTGSPSIIADVNRGPKNQIVTEKIRRLGMTFGGEKLLRETVEQLVAAQS